MVPALARQDQNTRDAGWPRVPPAPLARQAGTVGRFLGPGCFSRPPGRLPCWSPSHGASDPMHRNLCPRCLSGALHGGAPRPTRRCSIGCPTPRPDTPYVAALHDTGVHRYARSPGNRISRISSSTRAANLADRIAKSLKFYLASFRDHRGFPMDRTLMIGKRARRSARSGVFSPWRLLVPAWRHADRCVLGIRQIAARHVVAATRASPGYRGARLALVARIWVRIRLSLAGRPDTPYRAR